MCAQRKTTLRIYPESWMDPCEFKHFFADPEKPLEVDMGSGKGAFWLRVQADFLRSII